MWNRLNIPWGTRPTQLAVFALALVIAVALVACGGGSESSSPPPVASDPNVINGITVPPDPGPAGDATVAGIDTDNNGIRDDIDRFIATKYGTNATATKAAQTSVRGYQVVLMSDSSSKSASITALQDSGDAGACAGRYFRQAGLSSSRELNELFFRMNNTQARLDHRKAVVVRAGLFTYSGSGVCQ